MICINGSLSSAIIPSQKNSTKKSGVLVANRFVTKTDIAIEWYVVSSSFVIISHAPLHLLSRLKNRSTSILSVLS